MEKFLAAIITVLFILLIYAVYVDSKTWEDFKVNHNCYIIAKENSSVGYGIGSNGHLITGIIPGKTSYKCDDGVIYTR